MVHSLPHDFQYVCKRLNDFFGALFLLILFSPVMLLLAFLVRATSPGPALYRGQRMGLGGRIFTCYKFRTMHVDAEDLQENLEAINEASDPLFKIDEDPRVTRFGRWLRATGLDELPQLLNVVLADMSLVGPRPLPMRDCERITLEGQRRHCVLPGITGLWQIAPYRHSRENELIELDLRYVDNWSLWLDLKILVRTVGVFVRGVFWRDR